MNTTTCEGIDLSYLKMASNGDAEFEREMMISLQHEISEKMQSLYQYLVQEDATNSRMAAHSLKNLYSILGVASLSERYRTIEQACAESAISVSLVQLHWQGEAEWKNTKEQVDALIAAA